MAQSKALVTHISLLSTLLSRFQEHVARGIDKKFRVGNALVVDKAARKGKAHGRAASKTIVAMTEYATVWKDYPRNTDFYEAMIQTFGKLGPQCLDTTVSLLLEWLPDHSKRHSTLKAANPSYGTIEEYVFPTFLRKVNLDANDNRGMDLVRCAVDLAVADTIAYLLNWYDGSNLDQTTAVALHELGIHFQRQIEPTFLPHAEFYRDIRGLISSQWAVIIGAVSHFGAGVSPSELIGKCTRESDVDLLFCYRGLRFVRVNLEKSEANVKQYLEQLCSAVDNQKNKLLRLELLTALEGALISMDWADNHRIDTIVQSITKKCSKWMKTDELEGIVARIQAAMLAHGGFSQFEEQFDTMVGKKLLKKAAGAKTFAKRQDFLTGVLTMLRGKYSGDRDGWQPSGATSQAPPRDSPYSSVLLGETPSRLMARLKLIHTLLFQKKLLAKNADHGSVALAVEIVMQIAAHSLTFVKSTIVEYLLNDKSTGAVHRLIGMRVLLKVLSDEPSFWTVAGWRDGGHSSLKASEHGVSKDDLFTYFQRAIDDLLEPAMSQASLAACGLASEALPVTCITRPCELPPRQHEYEYLVEDLPSSFASMKVSECVQRWYDAIRDPDTSRLIGRERERFSAKKVSETLAAWGVSEQLEWHTQQDGVDSSRSVPHVREELKDRTNVELLITLMHSIALAPTNKVIAQFVDSDAFFGQFLIHADPDLAAASSTALQRLLLNFPEHRGAIFQGMIGLLLKPKATELPTHCLETLLSHLVLLTDMWVSLCTQPIGGGKMSAEKPPQHMIEEGDAVALLCLCHSSSTIRCLAVQFSNSIHALADSSSANETLSCLVFMTGEHISHRARFRYMLQVSPAPKPDVKVDMALPCPPVDVIACGDNNLLWSFTLAEMVIAVANARLSCLPLVKEQILQRLPLLSSPALAGTQGRVLSLNYHVLLFAGLHRKDPESQVQATTDHLSSYWSNLLLEGEPLEEVLLGTSCVNGSAATIVLKSAWQWYQALSSKKQKPKARLPVARLIRTVVRHEEFHRVQQLGELGTTTLVLNEVLGEFQSFLDSVPPPRSLQGPLFVCFAQIVTSTATGLFRRLAFCHEGPLRQHIQPSMPDAVVWKTEDRVKILETLHLWATTCLSVPQADVAKAVAHIKDTKLKDEKKVELENMAKDIPRNAQYAFTGLCRLCPLFVNRHVPQKFVDWATKVEELGCSTVRWLLAFQLEAALPIFIDQCYGISSQRQRCSMFIGSILDQFVPFNIHEDAPCKGLPEDTLQYQRHHLMQREEANWLPLNEASLQFSKIANEHAGKLIFLLCLNTTNPQAELRARVFAALARLVPFSFGRDQAIPGSERSSKILAELELIKPLFRSALVEEYREAARVIARITANYRRYTNDVFAEAFSRMFQVSSQCSKHWALEMLLPWCKNVDLNPSADEKHKLKQEPDEFLDLFFKNLGMDIVEDDLKLPQPLIALWQCLATAKEGNFAVVVDFLLRKAVECEANFTICASLVAYLYRSGQTASIDLIIAPLSIGAFADAAPKEGADQAGTKAGFWDTEALLAKKHRLLCTVLSHFAVDSPALFLPQAHNVLMWCLLRMSVPSEHEHISLLFTRTVELVLTLLQRARFTDDAILAKLRYFARYTSFRCNRLQWSCSKYEKESVMNKPNSLPHSVQAQPATLEGVEVVAVLQGCFTVLGLPAVNRGWCYSAMSWATRHSDPQVTLIAKQIACTVLSNCGDVGGVTRLLQRELLTALHDLQLMLDKSVARAIKAPGTDSSENPALAVPLLRGAVIETVKTLQVAVPHLQEACGVEQLLQLFWCCSAILRNSHPAFAMVINEVLALLFQLVQGGLFTLPEVAPLYEQHISVLRSSPDWYFKGLQPIVLQYIYQPPAEQTALVVFVQLLNHAPSPMLHLAAGNFEVALVCIIPWMHSQLLRGDITLDGMASTACKGIVDSLLAAYNVREVVGLFTSFMTGQFNSKADVFTEEAAKVLAPLAMAKYSGAIADMFTVIMRVGPPKYVTSVLQFTQALLRADGNGHIDCFVNVIKHCCTITGIAYDICSDTLLQTLLLTLKAGSVPGITSASQPLKSTQLQTTMRITTSAVQKLIGYTPVTPEDFPDPLEPADTSTLIVPVALVQLSQMPSLAQQRQMQQEQMLHLHQHQQLQQQQMMLMQQQQQLMQQAPQQQPRQEASPTISSLPAAAAPLEAPCEAAPVQPVEAEQPKEDDVDDALMQLDALDKMLAQPSDAAPPVPVDVAPAAPNPFLTPEAVVVPSTPAAPAPAQASAVSVPSAAAPSPPRQVDVNMFDLDPLEMLDLGEECGASSADMDTIVLPRTAPTATSSDMDMDTIVLSRNDSPAAAEDLGESPSSTCRDGDMDTIVLPRKESPVSTWRDGDMDTIVLPRKESPASTCTDVDMDTIVLSRADAPEEVASPDGDAATIILPRAAAAAIAAAAAPQVPQEAAPVPQEEEELEDFHFSEEEDDDYDESATATAEASDEEEHDDLELEDDPLALMDELLAEVGGGSSAPPPTAKATEAGAKKIVIGKPVVRRQAPLDDDDDDDDKTMVVPSQVSEQLAAAAQKAEEEKAAQAPVVISKPQVRRAAPGRKPAQQAPLKDTVDALLGDIDLGASVDEDLDDIDGDFDKLADIASTLLQPAPAPPQAEDEVALDDLLDALDALDQFQ